MNGFGRLGELYNLTPGTMAGLADIAGASYQPPPMSSADTPPMSVAAEPAPQPADPYSIESMRAAYQALKNKQAAPPVAVLGRAPPTAPSAAPPATPKGSVDSAFAQGFGTGGDIDPTEPPGTGNREDVINGRALPNVGGGGGVMIPGHWQPGTHETKLEHGYSQSELAPIRAATEESLESGQRAREVEAAKGEMKGIRDAAYLNSVAYGKQVFADRTAAVEQHRQDYVNSERDHLNQLAMETQKKVDPSQAFNQGTFGNVLGAIAVGLGQFGASLNHTNNTAWDIIKSKIDANITAQRENISNAREAYKVGQDLYARNLEAFDDHKMAEKATYINYLDQVGSMLDAKVADESLPLDQRERAAKLRQQAAEERKNAEDGFMKAAHTKVTEAGNEQYKPAQIIGGGGGAVPRSEHLITLGDGTTLAVSQDIHKESVEKIQNLTELSQLYNEMKIARANMKRLTSEDSWGNYDKIAAERQNIENLTRRLVYAENKGGDNSVVRESEYPRFEAGAGGTKGLGLTGAGTINPFHAYARGIDESIDKSQAYINKRLEREIAATGGQVVQKTYSNVPGKGLQPTMRYLGRDAAADKTLAPHGAESMDSRRGSVPQQEEETLGERSTEAPVVGMSQAAAGQARTKEKRMLGVGGRRK